MHLCWTELWPKYESEHRGDVMRLDPRGGVTYRAANEGYTKVGEDFIIKM